MYSLQIFNINNYKLHKLCVVENIVIQHNLLQNKVSCLSVNSLETKNTTIKFSNIVSFVVKLCEKQKKYTYNTVKC